MNHGIIENVFISLISYSTIHIIRIRVVAFFMLSWFPEYFSIKCDEFTKKNIVCFASSWYSLDDIRIRAFKVMAIEIRWHLVLHLSQVFVRFFHDFIHKQLCNSNVCLWDKTNVVLSSASFYRFSRERNIYNTFRFVPLGFIEVSIRFECKQTKKDWFYLFSYWLPSKTIVQSNIYIEPSNIVRRFIKNYNYCNTFKWRLTQIWCKILLN